MNAQTKFQDNTDHAFETLRFRDRRSGDELVREGTFPVTFDGFRFQVAARDVEVIYGYLKGRGGPISVVGVTDGAVRARGVLRKSTLETGFVELFVVPPQNQVHP